MAAAAFELESVELVGRREIAETTKQFQNVEI